jgi:hypothetical protein
MITAMDQKPNRRSFHYFHYSGNDFSCKEKAKKWNEILGDLNITRDQEIEIIKTGLSQIGFTLHSKTVRY